MSRSLGLNPSAVWVLVCGGVLCLVASAAPAVTYSHMLYDDEFQNMWTGGSYRAEVDAEHETRVYNGVHSMEVTLESKGAVCFLCKNGRSLKRHSALVGWIHGGSEGGQDLRLVLTDSDGNTLPTGHGLRLNSPAYIQGLSGGAFRIGGICPCAPTCACAMSTQDLLGLLGYGYTYLSLCEEGMDPEQEADAVIARVKDEVRAGRPAIVWHAFTTAEWDVVCGFDEGNGTFFGRGSYAGLDGYAEADQRRTITCTAICPPLGAILVGERASPLEAREAEIASLREAVQHAHSRENADKADGGDWVMLYGLACYDRWARDFQAGPPRLPTMGDRYCFGVYRSTHRAAAGYLRELAVKYPEASTHLERGAMQFTAEADALHACAEMLFPDWQLPQEADADLNARAASLLAQARDHYARGIDGVEAALGQID